MSNPQIPTNLIPLNDSERLNKLLRYDVLYTSAEVSFDTIALLAKEVFGTSSAFVNFIDKDKVFFKANISSISSNIVERKDSLCSLTILNDDITVFSDTHQYPRLMESPYVSSEGGIRFYAGAPIITEEGFKVGTVCVIDEKPRAEVTDAQLKMLKLLSNLTLEKLETRLAHRININAQDDRMHRLVHDLKNPVTSILAYSQILASKELSFEIQSTIGNKIERSSRGIEQSLNNILNEAVNANGAIALNLKPITVNELLNFIDATFEHTLKNKSQKLNVKSDCNHVVMADTQRIQDVFTNLISNAIKYSHIGSEIFLNCKLVGQNVVFEIKDNGVGLTKEDLSKLFVKFAKLSSQPTGNERSNGLGLSIVKMLTELHNGKVWAKSPGKNLGSSFFIALPSVS